MKYLEKTDNFNELINKEKVLVDFYADWCGPCQMLSPVLEELAKENNDVEIIKVNTDNFMELAQEYGIMSIPAIKLFSNGKLIKENVGFMTKEDLENFIK